jgi:hypothetical protein
MKARRSVLLTPEQMQDSLLRMEAGLYDLHTIVGQTVSNQAKLSDTVAKLTDTVVKLADTVGDLAVKHDAKTATVDRLAATVDRFIRAQSDGHNGPR